MNILKKIKEAATTRKVTISQIESHCGISNGSIGKWDSSTPKVDSLYKVSQFLNFPLEYFLSDNFSCGLPSITADELLVLEQYRKLESRDKREIKVLLNAKLECDSDDSSADHNAFPQSQASSISKLGKKNAASSEETA